MTSAYILIAAILVLGALIAALGDRIGTTVGKARLRLFNLRPRQTAILVTIITGTIISASTLGILFSLSKSLRQGVFQLDEILRLRRQVKAELLEVNQEKNRVERELTEAQTKQGEAKNRLIQTEGELHLTQAQLTQISGQANELRQEVKKILTERKQLLQQQEKLRQQTQKLQQQVRQQDRELENKQAEINAQERVLAAQENRLKILEQEQEKLQAEINSRDEQIMELDRAIASKDEQINLRETKLLELEKELAFLQREVEILEQYYQTYQELRERKIALLKGQVLTLSLVRITEPETIGEVLDQLLREANRTSMEALGYGSANVNQRIVQITTAQVEQLKKELQKGGEYLVRIISAGNYVQGEQQVRVFADISPNKQIYEQEQIIATVSIEPETMTEEDIQERLDFLFSVTQFRARRSGVLGKIQIGDGKITSIVNFIQELQKFDEPIEEIQAIATGTTYTAGPLQISLVVIADGEEILRL
jgi:uncharacterized protein (DUF3084 family)